MADQSREKSLLFLLTRHARENISQEHFEKFKLSLRTLQVIQDAEMWDISCIMEDKKRSVSTPKSDFIFYSTKSKDRYPIDPQELNRKSAEKVLAMLYPELEHRLSKSSHDSTSIGRGIFLAPSLFSALFALRIASSVNSDWRFFSIFVIAGAFAVALKSLYRKLNLLNFSWIVAVFMLSGFSAQSNNLTFLSAYFVVMIIYEWRQQLIGQKSRRLVLLFVRLVLVVALFFYLIDCLNSDFGAISLFNSLILFCTLVSMDLSKLQNNKLQSARTIVFLLGWLIAFSIGILNSPTSIFLIPVLVSALFVFLNFGMSSNVARFLFPLILIV